MHTRPILFFLAGLVACGNDHPSVDDPLAPGGDDPPPQVSDCDDGPSTVAAGPVSGVWCDAVTVEGDISVPQGSTLVIEAGTVVTLAQGTRITVQGTLELRGEAARPVTIDAGGGNWGGISVSGGTLFGQHADISGRGAQMRMTAGAITLADTVLDLANDELSPDCTSISGGAVDLDHVWITGCHCPIHISAASEVAIYGSLLDGAAVPVMIANTAGALNGNHFIGSGRAVEDVGGGISVDVADNYWGGGPPDIKSGDVSQFTGTDAWSSSPLPGVGPRR